MAVGTPVVATPRAVAGLAVRADEHVLVAEERTRSRPPRWTLLRDPARGARARRARRVRSSSGRYRWEASADGGRSGVDRPPPRLERAAPSGMSRSVHRRDGGWRLRWAILVAGDLLAAVLAYLLAFLVRVVVPFPLTTGYLPPLRFAEVHHHWPELLVTQLGVLYFLGLYEAHALTRPRDHAGPLVADGGLASRCS
jgi:hypothetical protein